MVASPSTPLTADAMPATALLAWLDRQRWWLFSVMGLFYLSGFNLLWRVGSDSALYMTLARNLSEGEGYTFGGEPHTLVHPLLPWLLAGLWRVTGVSFAVANAMMWLLTTGGLALWYRALGLRLGRPRAVAIVLMVAVAHAVFRYTFQILTDPLFFFGVAAVMAAYEGTRQQGVGRGRVAGELMFFAGGMFVVVASRPFMWAMVGAVACVGLWHVGFGPKRWVHGVLLILTGMVLGLFRMIDPRRNTVGTKPVGYEQGMTEQLFDPGAFWTNLRHDALPTWFDSHACEATLGIELGLPLNVVMGLVVLAMGLWVFRLRGLWGTFFLMTVGVMFVHTPVVRYFMPLIPILAVGWFLAAERLLRTPRWYWHWAAVAMLLLWVGPNLGRDIGFVIKQRATPFYEHYEDGMYQRLMTLADRQRDTLDADAVIVGEHARKLTWYFDRTAVDATHLVHGRHPTPLGRYVAEGRPIYLLAPVEDRALAELDSLGLVVVGEVVGEAAPLTLHRLRRSPAESGTVNP